MLPYVVPVDVLSFYFGNVHGLLKEHKNKGLISVAIYCVCRLIYKLFQARKNKQKCTQRKKILKVKHQDFQSVVDSLQHPLDISITDLSLEKLCLKVQDQSVSIRDTLLAFQIRAVSVDLYTNAVVDILPVQSDDVKTTSKVAKEGGGVPSLLPNIPISLAEVIHVQGKDATAGLSSYLQLEACEDAVVVQLLRHQGAVPIVRTNVPQTAYISFGSSNPIFGVTRNPFRADRSPGGTSSGEAVIVSARGSVLGVGTDIAGGIRIPAHFCGVCGFKPTSGRVSRKGVTITVEGQNAVATCVGPLSSEVAGLVAFMRSVCVPLQHQLDPTVCTMTFNNEMYESTRPLRVGYFVDDGHTKCVPSVRRTVMRAKMLLEHAGHTVVPFEMPDLLLMLVKLYLPVVLGDHLTTLIRYLAIDTLDKCVKRTYYLVQVPYAIRWLWSWWFSNKNPVNSSLLAVRCPQSVSYWWKHIREIEVWRQQFISEMKKNHIDVLLCPVLPFAAVNLGREESLTGCLTYCVLFNLLDFPAGTIPVSTVMVEDIEDLELPEKYRVETSLEETIRLDQKGSEHDQSCSSLDLPVGVQVASLPFQDEMVLRVLRDLESRKGVSINI